MSKVREWTGILVTVVGLIGIPLWVFAYNRSLDPPDCRVIHLTGVMKDGVWTTEVVTSLNYGLKSFGAADIKLQKGEKVIFKLTSADVTHGFYVPDLGLGPVEVEPGHVVEIPFEAQKTGAFMYYCTTVCGDCHHFMRGFIQIVEDGMIPAPPRTVAAELCQHDAPPPPRQSPLTDLGRDLFQRKGCVACHGESGRGGVPNPNYIKFTVPALDSLAERMYLYDPEDVETVIDLLEKNVDPKTLEDDPPFRRYNRFLAQYQSVSDMIRVGKPAGRRDTKGVHPPLNMPSWDAVLSPRDTDALIAYLLTQYPWEDEEQ
jgi:mono/diheme cytochrome c family protein